MENYKQKLLDSVREHVGRIRNLLVPETERVRILANKDMARVRPADQRVEMQLKAHAEKRVEELEQLFKSPYFAKCEVVEKNGEVKTLYFSKHQFSDESIYSWFAPAAAMRFENPGNISYTLPDGTKKELHLNTKEQYMIVDGKVIFFARETEKQPRELIYQEHFTHQKSDFALPEIVAQMEKAQDQVIRAHHEGPFIISGPAGSGKTTLALHRVAFLTQAPDTAEQYPPESIVVFVQDNGTKQYFSQLLPELGIHEVTITTFSEWTLNILDLQEYTYVPPNPDGGYTNDEYEHEKITALRDGQTPKLQTLPFRTLKDLYGPYLSKTSLELFEKQKNTKQLDRIDLTVLLRAHLAKNGRLETKRTFTTSIKGVFRKKTERTPVSYSLVAVDEFQNYLPEQLELIKTPLSKTTRSIVYVGDLAQQVYLGTIKAWDELGEQISETRRVRLDKVYRNTRSILEFIQMLGYEISIPLGIKEGPAVVEKITATANEEIEHIREHAARYKNGSVGIISRSGTYLEPFKTTFQENPHIHILTMNEAQGVEFDIVFLVGTGEFNQSRDYPRESLPEYIQERKRIQKDLLYVALTRAITELHILGSEYLHGVLKK